MEQAATEITRSFYADYGALALLVITNVGTSWLLFRYFTAELRRCREQHDAGDADWRQRYDALMERMLAQVVAQSTMLERLSDRVRDR